MSREKSQHATTLAGSPAGSSVSQSRSIWSSESAAADQRARSSLPSKWRLAHGPERPGAGPSRSAAKSSSSPAIGAIPASIWNEATTGA
jgi:hypothetical protein